MNAAHPKSLESGAFMFAQNVNVKLKMTFIQYMV